jgi:hypothetical protein
VLPRPSAARRTSQQLRHTLLPSVRARATLPRGVKFVWNLISILFNYMDVPPASQREMPNPNPTPRAVRRPHHTHGAQPGYMRHSLSGSRASCISRCTCKPNPHPQRWSRVAAATETSVDEALFGDGFKCRLSPDPHAVYTNEGSRSGLRRARSSSHDLSFVSGFMGGVVLTCPETLNSSPSS